MDRQTLLQMFTAAMRHRLQYGAQKHGAETWQELGVDAKFEIERLVENLPTKFSTETVNASAKIFVDIANYAAFAWADLQGLPGRQDREVLPPSTSAFFNFRDLQRRMAAFQVGNDLAGGPEWMALGVMEELGELAHCLLKQHQGIRGYDDPAKFAAECRDAIGDTLVFLSQVTEALGWDLQEIAEETVAHVTKRDWVNHPADADQVATDMGSCLSTKDTKGIK